MIYLVEAEWRVYIYIYIYIYASVNWSSLVQIMACRLVGAKPLSEPILEYCWLDPLEQNSVKSRSQFKRFDSRKRVWKCLEDDDHIVSASMSRKKCFDNHYSLSSDCHSYRQPLIRGNFGVFRGRNWMSNAAWDAVGRTLLVIHKMTTHRDYRTSGKRLWTIYIPNNLHAPLFKTFLCNIAAHIWSGI